MSPEWGLNLGLGSQKKCPFPQNRGVLSIGVTNTVYPLLMDTSIIRTSLYYGQFVWSHKCQKSKIPYLYNTDTSVKRTLGSVPLVSVLKRFDYRYIQRLCLLKSFPGPKFVSPNWRCPVNRSVPKERFHCINNLILAAYDHSKYSGNYQLHVFTCI